MQPPGNVCLLLLPDAGSVATRRDDRQLYLMDKGLGSKETVGLCWWGVELNVWFYQQS